MGVVVTLPPQQLLEGEDVSVTGRQVDVRGHRHRPCARSRGARFSLPHVLMRQWVDP